MSLEEELAMVGFESLVACSVLAVFLAALPVGETLPLEAAFQGKIEKIGL